MKLTLLPYSEISAILIWCVTSKVINPHNSDRLFSHEGDKVELLCETTLDNYVSWQFRVTHSGPKEEIFSGGEISPKYASEFKVKHEKSEGLYILVIRHAKISHSGEYICYDDDALSREHITIILNVTRRLLDSDAEEVVDLKAPSVAHASVANARGVFVCLLFAYEILVFSRM